MRRTSVSVLSSFVILFALLCGGAFTGRAQEATPVAPPAGTPPIATCTHPGDVPHPRFGDDVTSVTIGEGEPTGIGLRTLVQMQYTLESDRPDDPEIHGVPRDCYEEAVLVWVMGGELTLTVYEGVGKVSRAATIGTDPPEQVNGTSGGTAATLQAGDSLFVEAANYTLQNVGDEDTVLIVTTLVFEYAACPCVRWPT